MRQTDITGSTLLHNMKKCLSGYEDAPILLLKSSADIKPGFVSLFENLKNI